MTPPNKPLVVSNPLFNILLWIVTATMLLSLLTMVALAFWGQNPPTEAQKSLMDLCRNAFTTTLGAIVGLFCGRAASPDYMGPLPEQPSSPPSAPAKGTKSKT